MPRHRARLITALVVLAAAAWLVSGCGSSSSGTGRIRISLVDAPLDAEEINIQISSVQVHKAGGGWITVRDYGDTPLPADLLDYGTGGSSLLLADAPLETGHYTMVRLMLAGAEIVRGGHSYPIDLTNVSQTGVKCNGQFTVESGQLVALILDFNAGKSIINNPQGSDNFMLQPVLAMSPVDIAVEVTGKIEINGGAVAVPEDTEVNVYAQGHLGDEDYLVSGVEVESDGSFRIAVLRQGVYDFEITIDDAPVKELPGVALTAPKTDLNTIAVSTP